MTLHIKYCGCQTEEDYILLSSSKADIIGFVFAESKRKVTREEAASWVQRHGRVKKLAGVFQNASTDEMISTANDMPLDIIQCHGIEEAGTLLELKKQTQKEIYKALPYSEELFEQIALYSNNADALIVDSVSKGQFGGTGVPFSWSEVPAILNEAKKHGIPCFIAGGINPSNVRSLVQYKPYGIDLSGGIEQNGKKSAARIKELEGMM